MLLLLFDFYRPSLVWLNFSCSCASPTRQLGAERLKYISLYIFHISISGDIMKSVQAQIMHSPTLNTVLMVEKIIKDAREVIKISELKRRLPKQVMHQTLMQILDYLQESGKILITTKGVVWTYAPKGIMERLKEGGLEL